MAIIDLPHIEKLERSTQPKQEGFAINEVNYSGNLSQISFKGADQESSREEVWSMVWKGLEYATPTEVAAGAKSTIDDIREFYKQAQMNHVRWKPFEISTSRIWRVVPNSLKVTNPAGCVFEARLTLKFLYNDPSGGG